MANELDKELIRRMLDAQANPVADFDPTKITSALDAGLGLEQKIAARKQGQEDRVRALQEKIAQAKLEAEQRKVAEAQKGREQAFSLNPKNAKLRSQAFPAQEAELQRALELQRLKDASSKTGGGAPSLTPGQIAADKQFGKEFVDFETGGGRESSERNIGRLGKSVTSLEGLKEQSSGKKFLKRAISAVTPDRIEGLVLPGLTGLGQDIRGNVLGSLRATLGPQFTEKEGERIFAQTFDPRLDPTVNAERAKALQIELTQARKAKEAAVAYFKQHGTLAGFSGKPVTVGGVTFTPEDAVNEDAENTPNVAPTGNPGGLSQEEEAELEQLRRELGR
jgi:hypothetical protein